MILLLRRNKMGLASLRKINSLMKSNTVIRNDQTRIPDNPRMTFTWGYTRKLPHGGIILNKPSNVGKSSSKGTFRKLLYDNGLTMRTTTNYRLMESWVNEGGKFVLRPNNHYGGKRLHVIRNTDELLHYHYNGMYLSELINKDAEYRVYVTQGRVVFVAKKIPADDSAVAWNVTGGGRFENVRWGDWNKKVLDYAIKAMDLAGLDYGAVDVMTKGDDVYVLEVNTSPTMQEDYWTSCVAKSFDYMVDYTHNKLPIGDSGCWRSYVHPSLSEEAL